MASNLKFRTVNSGILVKTQKMKKNLQKHRKIQKFKKKNNAKMQKKNSIVLIAIGVLPCVFVLFPK
jgi:hypothetical protein